MCKIEQDVKESEWGVETFQKCVPVKNRSTIAMLVGKYHSIYYSKHPDDETITTIISLLEKCPKEMDTIEKKLIYIKKQLKCQ